VPHMGRDEPDLLMPLFRRWWSVGCPIGSGERGANRGFTVRDW
jgi:hypothetical protein